MVKPHSRRRELDPPSWLVEEWRKGDKNSMADLYSSVNFDKDLVQLKKQLWVSTDILKQRYVHINEFF